MAFVFREGDATTSPSSSTAISDEDGYVDNNILNQGWAPSPNTWLQRIPKSDILKGVVAFVDVWSKDGQDNRSTLFQKVLSRMGATVNYLLK